MATITVQIETKTYSAVFSEDHWIVKSSEVFDRVKRIKL